MKGRAAWWLLGVGLILLAPAWALGRSLFWGTFSLQFVPWWAAAVRSLEAGALPLWNPGVGMGAPLLANYQSALLYPPVWVLLGLGALGGAPWIGWGAGVVVGLHLGWAALGMHHLGRQIGLSAAGAAVAGLAFGLAGYFVGRVQFPSMILAGAWLPWVLVGVEAYWQEGRGWKLSAAVGLLLLAGHAQTAWYGLTLAGVWALYFWGGAGLRRGGREAGGAGVPAADTGVEELRIARGGERCAGAEGADARRAVHGADRSGAVPAADTGVEELRIARGGEGRAGAEGADARRAVHGADRSRAHPSGTWAGRAADGWGAVGRPGVGLLGALLLGMGLAAAQLLPTGEYLLQSQRAGGVDLTFGLNYSFWPWRVLTLIAPTLFGTPAAGTYWGPGAFWEDALYIGLMPFLLALASLGGLGRDRRVRFLVALIGLALALALGRYTPLTPWLMQHVPTFDLFQAPARYLILVDFGLALLAGIGLDQLRPAAGRVRYWGRLATAGAAAAALVGGLGSFFLPDVRLTFFRATFESGLLAVGCGLLRLSLPAPGPRRTPWTVALLSFVLLDLLLAGAGQNPSLPAAFYAPQGDADTPLLARRWMAPADEDRVKFGRYFQFTDFSPPGGWDGLRTSGLPNLPLLDGQAIANNFDPLQPGRALRWLEWVGASGSGAASDLGPWLALMNAQRVGHSDAPPLPRASDASAPAFFYACARAGSEPDAWAWVEQQPTDWLLVEGAALPPPARDCAPRRALRDVQRPAPDRVELTVESDQPGWVVISQASYPGWRAWVNGQEVPLRRGGYLFPALPVGAGRSQVTLAYRPLSFALGLALSGASLALSGASLALSGAGQWIARFARLRKKRRP